MIRKLLSSLVSLCVALSPVAASSQEYIFRYKLPVDAPQITEPEEPEFALGNDVQAWFVSAVGRNFVKQIPVATRSVAEWSKDSGEVPAGLAIDSASGEIVGVSEREQKTETLWYGADASGERIARAKMHFSTFQPVGQVQEVNWYTHTGEYFYSQIPTPPGVSVVRWDALLDNPAGMTTRNGAFEGRPPAAGSFAVAWRGYDYLDREVAFTYGEFLVQDGPVIEKIADQSIDKSLGESFSVLPEVKHSIGAVSFRLMPVAARPSGLMFNSTDGSIKGAYGTFDTTAKFVIEARDSGSGKTGLSNEFSLTTLAEQLDLSKMPDLEGVVGREASWRIAGGSDNLHFSLTSGQLPSGIDLATETSGNSARGVLSGIPQQPEIQENLRITASGVGAETVTSNPFKFRIFSGPMEATTTDVHARINMPFRSATPRVTQGEDPPYDYTGSVADGITFDPQTGTFASSGIAEAGSYDQRVVVKNESGRSAAADQIIRVYNNLTLAYAAETVGTRLSPLSVAPILTKDSVRQPAKYTLVQGTLPAFLSLNVSTGVISGRPERMEDIASYGPFVVSLVDGFGEAPLKSNPFTIKIDDRPALRISQVTSDIQRWVYNDPVLVRAENVYEGVTFTISDRGDLPATVSVHPEGKLLGSTTDPVGTAYAFKVHAVDGVGYTDDLDVSVTVIEPLGIGSIDGGFDRGYRWTVDRDFIGFSLPRVRNTYGRVTYTMGDNPFGLQLDPATLALSGSIPVVGTHRVTYTIQDETAREPITGTLTFIIQPDMAVTQSDAAGNRGAALTVAPSRANGIGPFKWEIVSGHLPATGRFPTMIFDKNTGAITGKAREEGAFPLTLKVTDATLQEKTVDFTLTVEPPLPFSFSYGEGWMTYGYLSDATPTYKNKSESVEWTFVSGTLPEGISFSPTGYYGGMFRGYPRVDGKFENIVIKGKDLGTDEEWTETVTLKVRRTGNIGLGNVMLKHRAGAPANTFTMGAGNITEPATYELVDNAYPENISVDPSTGALTASFDTVGKFAVSFKVTDLFDRTKTVSVTLDMVGALGIIAPPATTLKQHSYGSVPLRVENLIGSPVYALVSGTLPSRMSLMSAAIAGTPDTVGVSGDVFVSVTDSYDSTVATTDGFDIEVIERDKPGIATSSVQTALLDYNYKLSLEPRNVLGTAAWRLVSGALPDGVIFDPTSGSFVGKPTKFGIFADIIVEVTDTFANVATSGTKTFTIDVRQDGTPIEMIAPEELPFRVGEFFQAPSPSATNTVGDTTWSAAGLEGTGLSIDRQTGSISGTPLSVLEKAITFTVTDFTGRHASQTAQLIVKDRLGIVFAANNVLTCNYTFEGSTPNSVGGIRPAVAQPDARNVYGAEVWSISPRSALPAGLTFNTATGEFEGRPMEIGDFGPFAIALKDDLPGVAVFRNIVLSVVMNDDPIDLSVEAYTTKIGYPITTAAPTFGNELGSVTFFPENNDLAGTNLKLDDDTGTITGSFSTPQERNINIAVSDEHTDRVTSKPLALTVLPLMTLTGPQLAKLEAQAAIAPVVVTADNVAGAITWQELDSTQKELLPEGISFDTATGSFVGQTDEIGTFGPFTVSAIDAFHGFTDKGVSNPIMLEIKPGSTYLNLRDGALPDGTKRIASYSYDFMAGNLDLAGIDESSLNWTMTAEQGSKTPPGLTLHGQTGVLSGMPKESGSFRFTVHAASSGKATTRSFALNVGLPETELTMTASNPPDGERGVSYTFDMKNRLATTNIPASDVKWTSSSDVPLETGEIAGLPAGITLNKDTGIMSGTPTGVGAFKFATRATWDESNATAEHAEAEAVHVIVINGVSYKFVQLSGGTNHTCGLTANGGVQCWGAGSFGQLGNGLTNRSLIPVSVSGLEAGVASIAVGGDTSCAVTTAGAAKCWGRGDYGRLGNGTDVNSLVPTDVSGLTSGVKSISSGINHSCVVLTTGAAKCWGPGSAYQLGNGQSITSTNVPVDVKSLTSASSIAVGQAHTCALTSTGGAKCWGNGANGRLGNSLDYSYAVPADVTGLTSGVKAISAGGEFTCAILQSDRVNCWGANSSGQLGIGSTTEYNSPRTVGTLMASRIATGANFACAVTLTGNVSCWGRGTFGQMGAGANVDTNVSPVSARVSSVQSVMAGTNHICVLTTSNEGKCWGNGGSGQLGDGKLVNSNLPVDVGSATAP